MHELVSTLPDTFRAAYPADTEAAVAALTAGREPWPGASMIWADIDGAGTTILRGLPRALRRTS